MLFPDPIQAAQRQLERDRAATHAFPQLLPRKLTRMSESPLAYLRGSARLFYELLAQQPELEAGPSGAGWLVADAHLENFGAFRSADARGTESVVFDVNDFDEAIVGPWRWDVLRLLSSLILGGRELGSNGKQSVRFCAALGAGYIEALGAGDMHELPPPPVRRLLEKVEQRTHKDLLDRRTERVAGARRFIRGERYLELSPELSAKARAAFASYVERLDPGRQLTRDHFAVEDVAFRVAGCGSLGALRIAVLTRGKGGLDNRWVFDMKAEHASSARGLPGATTEGPDESPAGRVKSANAICLAHPPRMIETTELDDESLFVRRLLPQEDKLELRHLRAEELPGVARHLGALLGRAHARGLRAPPTTPWTEADFKTLTNQAIVIAGIHEAAYLSLCASL